ncbi:hypothetical protein DFQ28_007392, partial [Apophysomyces sp. BC1034]
MPGSAPSYSLLDKLSLENSLGATEKTLGYPRRTWFRYLLYTPIIATSVPKELKRILVTETQKQLKRRTLFVGESIESVQTSEAHQKQKRVLLRAFSVKHIQLMEHIILQIFQQLSIVGDHEKTEVNMYPLLLNIVQRAFTQFLYGSSMGLTDIEMAKASESLRTYLDNLSSTGLVVLYCRPLARVLRYFSSNMTRTLEAADHLDVLRERVLRIWMETEDKESMDGLLFRILTAAAAETERPLSTKVVMDNLLSLSLGGIDSTASAVVFNLISLASHPEWQRRVREELMEAKPESTTAGLPVLNAVISESLRLYPPFPETFPRVVQTDNYVMSGYHIPRGTMITGHLMALHRDPTYWSDADKFDPSRFMDKASHAQWYLPFGAGPEACIGKKLALTTIRAAVSEFVRTYSFRSVQPIEPGAWFVGLVP